MCEIMASLVCDASLLKSTDYRLKKKTFSHKICNKCDLGILETINHLLVMQCPFYSSERYELYALLEQMNSELANRSFLST